MRKIKFKNYKIHKNYKFFGFVAGAKSEASKWGNPEPPSNHNPGWSLEDALDRKVPYHTLELVSILVQRWLSGPPGRSADGISTP